MAEEIPLEALEGERVILEWIDSLPKLGYVHAVEIPADRDDLLEAARKGWTIDLTSIFCSDDEVVEDKRHFSGMLSSLTIGEVIPIFPFEKLPIDNRSPMGVINDVPGLRGLITYLPGTTSKMFVVPFLRRTCDFL